MTQAIVDPDELRLFAQMLKQFNQDLADRATALSAQLHSLSSTWRDQENLKFTEQFEQHLRYVLTEYLIHYNTARPHRALGQLPPAQAHTRPPQINLAEHRVRRKQVLGGLTNEYQIAA